VTIRYADGTTETLSQKQFAERAGHPSWQETEKEFAVLLRAYRQSGSKAAYHALKRFATANGLESRLEAKARFGGLTGPESASWR
jgi:hypothetical protein